MKLPVKITLITLTYFLLMAMGYILVFVALNMDQTMFIRILIGGSGVVWSILSIWFVWFKTDYGHLWRKQKYRRQYKNIHKLRGLDPDYSALYEKYPHSIRRHERHCIHHDISPDEMIRTALEIPEEEWAAREAFRTQE